MHAAHLDPLLAGQDDHADRVRTPPADHHTVAALPVPLRMSAQHMMRIVVLAIDQALDVRAISHHAEFNRQAHAAPSERDLMPTSSRSARSPLEVSSPLLTTPGSQPGDAASRGSAYIWPPSPGKSHQLSVEASAALATIHACSRAREPRTSPAWNNPAAAEMGAARAVAAPPPSRPRRCYLGGLPARFAAGAAFLAACAGAAFFAGFLLAAGGTASASAVRSTTESSPPKSLGS